jgi:hypothetical protein
MIAQGANDFVADRGVIKAELDEDADWFVG